MTTEFKILSGTDHLESLKILESAILEVKNSQTYRNLCDEYSVPANFIDLVPMCFADLDVSARTDHAILYFNINLLKKPEELPSYVIHEVNHFLQQTTGDGPTKGSTDDTYLKNDAEIEGFNNQTEFISETKGDNAAEKYVTKLLDHHDIKSQNERKKHRRELLQLAFLSQQSLQKDSTMNVTLEQAILVKKALQAKLGHPEWLLGIGVGLDPNTSHFVKVNVTRITNEILQLLPSKIGQVPVQIDEQGQILAQ